MEEFTMKMSSSGYNTGQIKEVIESDILGHSRRRKRLGKEHRKGMERVVQKNKKKILEKTTCYKRHRQGEQGHKNK